MCGITALKCKNTELLFLSLLSLQHRGQDSYGYSDGKNIEKYMGLIKEKPRYSNGDYLLGHTRYRTSGSMDLKHSQPFKLNGITFVHNGTVQLDHPISDSYALLELLDPKNIKKSIRKVIATCKGAFFCILLLENNLYAFKDRYGIRPGGYGINDNGEIIISSENHAFKELGFNFVDDIRPGEIFSIESNKIKSEHHGEYSKPCIFEFIYFSKPESKIYGMKVKDFRVAISNLLVEKVKDKLEIDYVCGIPSSARLYAQTIADGIGKPYFEPRVEKKRSFILATEKDRKEYIKKKYTFKKEDYRNNILFVDDSIVRGSTLKYILEDFRKKGCCNLYVLSCSPKVYNKNNYGYKYY